MTQPQTTTRPADARRRVWPHRLIALALVLAGGAVTGWPVVETFANNTAGLPRGHRLRRRRRLGRVR